MIIAGYHAEPFSFLARVEWGPREIGAVWRASRTVYLLRSDLFEDLR